MIIGGPDEEILLSPSVRKEKNMNMFFNEKEELAMLTSFPDRAKYLFEKQWDGTARSFCSRFNIGKTTFYNVMRKKNKFYSDYVIELFARAYGVSCDFLKYGGTEKGYYKPRILKHQTLKEDVRYYGTENGRKHKKVTFAVANAAIEIRIDKAERLVEILLKIKDGDLFF